MAKQPWKAWHEVVELRDDLRSGELAMHMFAADLYEVLIQDGKRPIYEKPEEFFALTFPTYNLRQLVRDVILRLAGKSDKAVRQLELTYGGGKTHTLITLFHLVNDPDKLPDLPAVAEFAEAIGQKPPRCRIAGLCFDKLDVEKGMKVRSPEGKTRILKQPWSILAYQLAGDAGLKLLHADNKVEERDSAPAENLLTELFELPGKDGLGTLILIDEVLMYAREKVAQDKEFRSKLVNFFQYLTQAVAKVDRCCLVASLLATDPRKSDTLGMEIQSELYNIFQRQREEAVEPVVKEDVAEVLRRRFFTAESLKKRESFKQHVMAALKGIVDIDESTAKQKAEAEERFLKSFPFHPDLTEVLYSKWTQLASFQRTRGVLRTFALALREAEKWDESPLIGPAAFLSAPEKDGLSEALREMVTVTDTEEWEGKKQAWTGILDNEFKIAREIQGESAGLRFREVEQAVVATFLHSQPVGQNAKTRDLIVLLGATRPDRIELNKGLARWAHMSHWLDDQFASATGDQLPGTWRLGNRPNLTQMHSVAVKNIPEDTVRARLIDDIGKTKELTGGAQAAGARPHNLPTNPKDIDDDGLFHYAVLSPKAASESGKPSAEAKRYLDETTGPDRPRINRNAVILLTPSKDGVEVASASIRNYLAWETVRDELKKQQPNGSVDAARHGTLNLNVDKAKHRIKETIRQAYCIVVTVSEKDDIQAFKITVTDEPHFNTIKNDRRSRVQDTAITAEALLPEGPYDLWKPDETSRRVRFLTESFSQIPRLPKMLKTSAILDTLADGCEQGAFVLSLKRPDGTTRTWWMTRPDDGALNDPALELILSNAATLVNIAPELLLPGRLPELWQGDSITENNVVEYFSGERSVTVEKEGYQESIPIPKADRKSIDVAVDTAVAEGKIWLLSGPTSLCGEPLPMGVLHPESLLFPPPPAMSPAEILPENLPNAWSKNDSDEQTANGHSIATALSAKDGRTLPWKTIRDIISDAIRAGFIEAEPGPQTWPCDFSSAQYVKFKAAMGMKSSTEVKPSHVSHKTLVASINLEPSQLQELGDVIPKLLEIKTKQNVAMRFNVQIEIGDGVSLPSDDVKKKVNAILKNIRDDFQAK